MKDQSRILRKRIARQLAKFLKMLRTYMTCVVSTKGLRIKGDDTSIEIASIIDEKSNKMSKDGWELFSITPSLLSEGALIKLLLTFVKNK